MKIVLKNNNFYFTHSTNLGVNYTCGFPQSGEILAHYLVLIWD
jgi:hypothetical protein